MRIRTRSREGIKRLASRDHFSRRIFASPCGILVLTLSLPASVAAWKVVPVYCDDIQINYPQAWDVISCEAEGECDDCSFVGVGAEIGLYCSNGVPVQNYVVIDIKYIVTDGEDSVTGVWNAVNLNNFKLLQDGFNAASCDEMPPYIFDPPEDLTACN